MPSLSTTYLLPAIFLNPVFVLHIINTFSSHLVPTPHAVSLSPHAFMESLGPVPGTTLYLNMHTDDQLCWRYTALMVFVQLLAFGRVSDNRVERKAAKAAKVARERARKERLENDGKKNKHIATLSNGHAVGNEGTRPDRDSRKLENGTAKKEDSDIEGGVESLSEESLTETSEEEMIL